MEETAYDIRQADTLAAWQQALAEVPQTPALSGALLRRRDDLFGRFVAWYGRLRSRPRAERRRWQRQLGLSLAGIALLLAVNGAPAGALAPAATIIVTNGTSTIANGDGCSLPEAIINANANNLSGSTDCAAGSGADTIDLQTNVTLTVVNDSTLGNSGLPVVASAITIEGNGQTISRQSGSPDFRLLTVNSAGNLTLNNATVSGGVATTNYPLDQGGGLMSYLGTATINGSTFTGNWARLGGGIRATGGTMTVANSTITGNGSTWGGGIYGRASSLTVMNSTITGNTASFQGAGMYTGYGATTVTVQNSTISGNSAGFYAGGIKIRYNTVVITNSTIAGNSAQSGGGIQRTGGAVTVLNSIIALQATGGDCNTTLTSGGYNIESGTSCGFTGTGDLQNVSSASLALGALANNGGPTQTRALGFGSVALDRIPIGALEANGCGVTVTTDQRGLPRAEGAGAGGTACDVGAYEAQTPPLAVTLASFDAQAMADHILLSWETVSEANNAGFNLYRSASPAGPDELLAYVPSQAPGSTLGASYSFDDDQVAAGQTWYYWLEDVDLSGATSLHGPVSATIQAPTAVTLTAI
ncbi:MAG TPA: right-handed parallel beta-helix repeat-containing protein, partial [Anaerolineae bacterium]|nr:right-handed parallel beta-helix repeat-containing protein [Anaerolineae bacterium]